MLPHYRLTWIRCYLILLNTQRNFALKKILLPTIVCTSMTDLRTLNNLEEDYFRQHSHEVDAYLFEIFDEYARDGDSASLLASLRVIAKVKGISALAMETGMTRQGLQKALSRKGNPRLDNINAVIHALGYRLTPVKI